MTGTFDRPDRVPPIARHGDESRLPWHARLPEPPGDHAPYAKGAPRGYLPRIIASNRQHPDHDTAEWPSSRRSGATT